MSDADRLIVETATGVRQPTTAELQQVLDHVARAGFDPSARESVGGRVAGITWRGRVLKGSDRLTPSETHYLRHAIAQQEWPSGTTLQEYLSSLRAVVLDEGSGVLVSRRGAEGWHLAVVRLSGDLRGPGGHEWVMVEYRVATGRWMTAFQLRDGLAYFTSDPAREELRWLRQPT